MYKLKITKTVKNENYKEELKECRDNNIYGMSNNYPSPTHEIVDSALEVEISEKQFEAIRKEVLKNF